MRAPELGSAGRTPVRAIGLLLALELVVYTVSTIPGVRSHPGFDPLLDGWLQGACYVTIAVLALLRPLRVRENAAAWGWIAGALTLRALGFVIYLGFVRTQQPPPYPSAADWLWLAMPVAMLVGLALLARPLIRELTLGVALDGVVGGAAAAGVGIALTDGTLARLTAEGVPESQLLTNIAYPITDLMLLVAVLGLLTVTGWRPGRAIWLLAAGLVGFAIVDSVFLYQSSLGIYHPGSLLAPLSIATTALIALAAWSPTRRVDRPAVPQLFLPAVFSLACLFVLVDAGIDRDIPFGALLVCGIGVAIAIARTAVSFRDVLRLSGRLRDSEQATRSERDRLAAVLAGASGYAIIGSGPETVTFFSAGAEQMLGYRAEEVVGRMSAMAFHDPAEIDARARELGLTSHEAFVVFPRRSGPETREWTYVHKSGRRFPVSLTVTPLRRDGGEVTEVLGIARDVTAERRLARYRATRDALVEVLAGADDLGRALDAALDTIVAGMGWDLGTLWLIGDDGLQCFAVAGKGDLEALRRAAQGYSVAKGEGIAGRTWELDEPIWVEDLEDVPTPPGQARAAQAWGREVRAVVSMPIRAGDGRHTLGVLQLLGERPAPLDPDLEALLGTICDRLGRHIESTRTAVELADALADAERANRTMSEFVSRISHELRTPLNAILGFAQILENELPDRRQRDQVAHIETAGSHLVSLIDDLLDLGQLERGDIRLSTEPVPASEVLRSALDLVRPLIYQRGLDLDVDMHGGLYEHVLADYQRLRQVLLNLLSNAVKYNRPHGRITVSFQEPEPGRLRFCVADTGPGIRPEDLPRLFLPFDRLGAERGDEPGTGLGLSVSQRLVHAMGGEIGVEALPGEGSRFWVDLDRAPAPPAGSETAVTAPAAAAEIGELAGTILYIEDNPSNLKLVADVLAAHPQVELLTAVHGRSGIALAGRRSPDLILLDAQLPDLYGEQVLELLRADAATAEIPVVVLSADATDGRRRDLLDRGAAAYVTKPFDITEFLRTVAAVLRADSA